jgi:hypothetical protein
MLPKNLIEEFNKVANLMIVEETKLKEPDNINTNNITDEKTKKVQKTKCTFCSKKTGLLGFGCKCGGNFCANHRHTDQHKCTCIEQIIKEDREILAKNNQKVVADKIIKI